jgi:hypothetical protein
VGSKYVGGGPIIIGREFRLLQKLELWFDCTEVMFESGAMPNLNKLQIRISLSRLKSAGTGSGVNFGIQHLFALPLLRVHPMDGSDARAFKSISEAHPNRPTFQMLPGLP